MAHHLQMATAFLAVLPMVLLEVLLVARLLLALISSLWQLLHQKALPAVLVPLLLANNKWVLLFKAVPPLPVAIPPPLVPNMVALLPSNNQAQRTTRCPRSNRCQAWRRVSPNNILPMVVPLLNKATPNLHNSKATLNRQLLPKVILLKVINNSHNTRSKARKAARPSRCPLKEDLSNNRCPAVRPSKCLLKATLNSLHPHKMVILSKVNKVTLNKPMDSKAISNKEAINRIKAIPLSKAINNLLNRATLSKAIPNKVTHNKVILSKAMDSKGINSSRSNTERRMTNSLSKLTTLQQVLLPQNSNGNKKRPRRQERQWKRRRRRKRRVRQRRRNRRKTRPNKPPPWTSSPTSLGASNAPC